MLERVVVKHAVLARSSLPAENSMFVAIFSIKAQEVVCLLTPNPPKDLGPPLQARTVVFT
ncbi:hypothetical protein HJC23_006086 [Cyclotella cryptica]|uniref:Uncharacterized protein n=1 Tax=Cyclotella cryptica TaxID=29204 RepID=A0ABD3QKW5_9STRA